MESWTQRLVARNIRVAYQPYVRTTDGSIAGYEALVRLALPAEGAAAPDDADWLEPDAFVADVEEAGHGQRLTGLVCAHALADARHLLRGHATVAINVPLDVLLSEEFCAMLASALVASAVRPAQLALELTESQPIADFAALSDALLRLRRFGLHVALDDAGPAVPAHRTLIDLPFATLKLDKSLAPSAIKGAPGHEDLIRLIGDAHRRGLTVIAEGIEDQRMADALSATGADMLQGFFIGRPMPLADACAWRDARVRARNASGPPPSP